jgi:hypothetical protein
LKVTDNVTADVPPAAVANATLTLVFKDRFLFRVLAAVAVKVSLTATV